MRKLCEHIKSWARNNGSGSESSGVDRSKIVRHDEDVRKVEQRQKTGQKEDREELGDVLSVDID